MTTQPSPRTASPDEPGPVSALRESLHELVAESQALRVDVHGAEKARKRASQINIALLALLGLFVALLVIVTWQNNKVVHQVNKTNAFIADCTGADGACYKENAKRTQGVVGDIIRAEIFMAECARLYPDEAGPTYDAKLETCVAQRLSGPGLRPTAPAPGPGPSVPASPSGN